MERADHSAARTAFSFMLRGLPRTTMTHRPSPELDPARAALLAVGYTPGDDDVDAHPDDAMLRHHRRIAASEDAARVEYLRGAHELCVALDRTLAASGLRWADVGPTLDFAAGFGRVARFLRRRAPADRLDASDILPGTTEWNRMRYGIGAFDSATDPADVRFPRRYGLILVSSLFTHLPAARARQWLSRLREALAEDGTLVVTTHGLAAGFATGVVSPRDVVDGFAYARRNEIEALDLEEYGSSYVSPEAFRALLAETGFAAASCRERGLWRLQDVFVARPAGAASAPPPAPFGAIEDAAAASGGAYYVRGVVDVAPEGPGLAAVEISLGGLPGPRCALSGPTTVVDAYGDVRARYRFEGSGALPVLPPGRHAALIVAEEGDGARFVLDGRPVDA